MKSNRGFTLIELAVVLAIIAVLAAILTPLVTTYIDEARNTRARSDVRLIAQAVQLHQRDTGQFPIYATQATKASDTATADALIGDGYTVAAATLTDSSSGSTWTGITTASLSTYLNTNVASYATSSSGGSAAYLGPYMGSIGSDPWGGAYYVTAANLRRASTIWGFAISAGPNGALNTVRTQVRTAALTISSDDLVAIIK